MLRIISSLKDFLEEEKTKLMMGNIRIEQCIFLTKEEIDIETKIIKKIIYVFEKEGNLIGKIENYFI